jgi:hypothetical protein
MSDTPTHTSSRLYKLCGHQSCIEFCGLHRFGGFYNLERVFVVGGFIFSFCEPYTLVT